ncbi:unnamed protein product, partial [Meganyctiphanes norvegica]
FFLDTLKMNKFAMIDEVAGLWLMHNKTLYLSFLLQLSIACPMNFKNYPFDVQVCEMTLASCEYHSKIYVMALLKYTVYKRSIGPYKIIGWNSTINRPSTHKWCIPVFPAPTSAAIAHVTLRRLYSAYLLTVFMPSGFFVGVAWISFFWPADAVPARTVLVVTSLLTTISMYSAVRLEMPMTAYVK